jgi:hypothetical protein
MKFRNKKMFRDGIPAYTGSFRALDATDLKRKIGPTLVLFTAHRKNWLNPDDYLHLEFISWSKESTL